MCGPQAADKVKTVPLSDNTVKDRIDKMAADCQNQLHEKLRNANFAIQLDETTTVSDEAVLIVYVQYIDGEDLTQDILMSTNLSTTTTGQDIFLAVDSYLSSNNLPYENLVACCTDGAAAMMGKNKGFNSRLKEKVPGCVIFHCMIYLGCEDELCDLQADCGKKILTGERIQKVLDCQRTSCSQTGQTRSKEGYSAIQHYIPV